jgi:hypothetical protein
MLDVHPALHATTTWRFFIHIATIVIGLLIAIGLEQTVELIHHDAPELWTMTPDQAERLASTASDTKIAIQGLLFR